MKDPQKRREEPHNGNLTKLNFESLHPNFGIQSSATIRWYR